MGVLLITHDLSVVARVASRVLVMYAGRLVESGAVGDIFARPRHPYTAGLLASIHRVDQPGRALRPIAGAPLDALENVTGCPFAPRCAHAAPECAERPELREISPGHLTACWRAEEVT